jgi:predicted HTH transcriptional regulator
MDMRHMDSDLQQLLDRLSLGEAQDLEFKQMLPKGNQLSRTVTAMANTVGGWILLGIRDDGTIVGLETDLDKAQTTVSEAIQCVSPVPKTRIQIVLIEQKKLLVTRIERAPHPIFHTFEGAIYQRIGSVNRRLEGMSQLAYLRNHHILNFDESIDTDVSIDSIDGAQIQRFLESRNQSEYLKHHDLSQLLVNQKLGVLDANTYAEINQISYPTASADIAELVGYGFVKKVGAYRGAYYVLCAEG